MTGLPQLSEKAWQGRVVDLARRQGWVVWHVRDSRTTTERGWPDLAMLRERLVLAELKTQTGTVRPEQAATIRRLRAAGVEAYLWRPSDWDAVITTLLRPVRRDR